MRHSWLAIDFSVVPLFIKRANKKMTDELNQLVRSSLVFFLNGRERCGISIRFRHLAVFDSGCLYVWCVSCQLPHYRLARLLELII